jgi:hypothetical protein
MSWNVSDVVNERTKFVLSWEERFSENAGRVTSPSTVDVRYQSPDRIRMASSLVSSLPQYHQLDALLGKSKRPHYSPTKVRRDRTAWLHNR